MCVLANRLAVRCTSNLCQPRAFLHPIWQVKAIACAVGMYGTCLRSQEALLVSEAAKMGPNLPS